METYKPYKRPTEYWCNDDEQVRIIEAALDLYEKSFTNTDAKDAKRYQWLRIHGAALAGSYHQREGLVRRVGNLDEEIDLEMSRG